MRVSLGDFVPGNFAVPQNPVYDATGGALAMGMGDFVPGLFVVPQNPVLDATGYPLVTGLGDCGCGCGGGCNGGLGSIDWSLNSTSIGTEIGIPSVPNWLLYMGVIGVGALVYSQSDKGGRRRR